MHNRSCQFGIAEESLRYRRAILTYHRVIPEHRTADRHFYDVPEPRFRDQMQRVADQPRMSQDGFPMPRIELTFDDGTQDHLAVAEFLARLGLIGTFFIITGRLGERGHLARADLRTLQQLGHRIGSHTVTHRKICDVASTDLLWELRCSREDLEQELGSKIEWFAPPAGYLDKASLMAIFDCGYRYVRTLKWGYAYERNLRTIGSIPILPSTTDLAFEKIITGRATFYAFRLKEALKALVGERVYVAIRNRYGSLRS